MKTMINPSAAELRVALERPLLESSGLESLIQEIFTEVSLKGDQALKVFTRQFDRVDLDSITVSDSELSEAENALPESLKTVIRTAASNIERFHAAQSVQEREIETTPGVICWRKSVGIQTVGMYVPGGTAPLFSTVLMLGIPAKLAGCENRILCTPAGQNGTIHPAILVAAKIAGITQIFKVGGAQAIAAMSLGTETIPKADKLFGPGNQYVTAAKVFAQKTGIPIDMPAGPSEVLVAADDSIAPVIIASDLLAQAEHGTDSQVVFLTDSEDLAKEVQLEVEKQLQQLPRAEIAAAALENSVMLVEKASRWSDIINQYAPEHLIVMGKYEEMITENVVNAGSVFIGQYTAESFGDYASGTNHTLPTNGFAKSYSGVSLDSFVKKITYQRVSKEGLVNLGPTVIAMAEAEALAGHAEAVKVRLSRSGALESENKPDVRTLIRPDLRNISPYSSARDEFEGAGSVFLDANENALTVKHNRYPDPLQRALKNVISEVKGIPVENLFLGNGSDEVLDLILRLTTIPYRDKMAFLSPSYGMYRVLAKLNALEVSEIRLDADFQIDSIDLLQQAAGCKVLILCNPNNPSGNVIPMEDLVQIVREFKGVVVVDEAYSDFCPENSLAFRIREFPNLLVVQTLSKAYGMAGLRIGMAVASEEWIKALNRIKAPYNLSSLVQEEAVELLRSTNWEFLKSTIVSERERLFRALDSIPVVEKVFPSKANFLLFKVADADKVYAQLLNSGVVVRNRTGEYNCTNMLRVSVGTPEENTRFIEIMKSL
ncbi:histidinol dehydrogenase [Fluviicola sp.]|uniref:histidinol dehydrogenase n=1 Tax=Fluviicola sp. TaxID=1917219 RepID=UPI0031CFE9F7